MILVIGVNGSGKTTTIGKLARRWKSDGKKVLLAAGDTFRAAAIEQMRVWAEREGVPCIFQKSGADPSAVAYDAVQAGVARAMDVVIVDTAGRFGSGLQRPPPGTRPARRPRPATRQTRTRVITSYSIHYTKLYEKPAVLLRP